MVEIRIPSELRLQLKDLWDIRATQRGVLVMEGGNTLTAQIPAIKGDQGDPGRDGVPPRFHEPIREDELPNPTTLGPNDVGWIWPIRGTSMVYVYNGHDLIPIDNFIGGRGLTGPAPQVRIGDVNMTEESLRVLARQDSEGVVVFDFDIPRGIQGRPGQPGPPGDAGKIIDSPDYDDGGTPAARGDVLTMRPDGDWGPARPQVSAGVVKKSGQDSDWQNVDTGVLWRGDYMQIVTLTIPPQTVPWEPEVYGMVDARVDGAMVRMDMEAHLGAVSGPLLALGPGPQTSALIGEWSPRQLVPAADETAEFNASSTIVPAGQPAEIFLIARRVESLTSVRFRARKDRAYLRVHVNPVQVHDPEEP